MIVDRRPTSEIKRVARDEGMITLRESGLAKIREGVTSVREINKVTFVEHSATFREGIYQSEFARKVARWLDAMPHPPLALEISQDRVARRSVDAHWRAGQLRHRNLPNGAMVPSAVETNIVDPTR